MHRLRPYPVALFAGVTLLIWGNRVWLAWTDDAVGLAAKVAYSVPITWFVLAAGTTLLAQWRGASGTGPFRALVSAFVGSTIVFWAIRLPIILLHDHPAGFKVVHSALAGVSIWLAVRAWRSLRRSFARSTTAIRDLRPQRSARS